MPEQSPRGNASLPPLLVQTRVNSTFLICALCLLAPPCQPQVAAASPQAQSDQIIFLNGDRLSGELIEVTADTIRFKTAAMGEVTVKWETIKEVASNEKWVVTNPQKKFDADAFSSFSRAIITRPGASPALQLDDKPPVTLSANSVAEFGIQKPTARQLAECLGPYPDDPFRRQTTSWFLGVNAPESLVNGTQSQQQFGGIAALDVCEQTKLNHTVLSAGGQHTRTWKIHQPSITTDVFDGTLTQKHLFHRPDGAGIYGVADFFFNNSLGMALQKSFGAGFLSPQFKKGNFSYTALADVRYFNERLYSNQPSLNLAGVRVDGQAKYTLHKFSINGHAWINPMFNDAKALQGLASIGPRLTLNPWVCLSLTEEDDYLGNSPAGKRKNYFSSSLTLKIQHGADSCN
jgi:hypothetical protein